MDLTIPKEFDYLEINEQYEYALDSIYNKEENTIIIGNAGSGKSEFLNLCRALDKNNDIESIVLAPTGIAAINVSGQTIHSFFKIPIGILNPANLNLKDEVGELLYYVDKIYIDEISMCRADLIDSVDYLLRQATGNASTIFGGKQMVFIGDLLQLPPVIGNSESKIYSMTYGSNPYFFGSGLFSIVDNSFKRVVFSKIYRQSDGNFKDILNRIREGKQTDEDLNIINEKVMPQREFNNSYPESIYVATTNKVVDRENIKSLNKLATEEYLIPANISGQFNERNFLVPKELILKPGAKIMMLINDNSSFAFNNGTLGVFQDIIDEETIKVEINHIPVYIKRTKFAEYQYVLREGKIKKEEKCSIQQFPLKLAYAITVHKAQGSTFKSGYVDMGYKVFAPHMVYVALSRFTDLEAIGLKRPITHKDIMIDDFVKQFLSTFEYVA